MSKCPVCNVSITPLAEYCDRCLYEWKLGQDNCPAKFQVYNGIMAKCELEFGHKGKHRTTGFKMGDIEVTLLWHYPENVELIRSEDWKARHANHHD